MSNAGLGVNELLPLMAGGASWPLPLAPRPLPLAPLPPLAPA